MVDQSRVQIYNDTGDDMPAGALCQWAGGFTSRGAMKVVKPTGNDSVALIVNGPFAVGPGEDGYGYLSGWVLVAFDPESDPPVEGDTLGSVAGSWWATVGGKGFRVLGATEFWAGCIRTDVDTVAVGAAVFDEKFQTGGSYSITPDGTWVTPPGVSVDLPSAGVYELVADLDFSAYVTANAVFGSGSSECATIECRLYNVTDGNVIVPYPSGLPYAWTGMTVTAVCGKTGHSTFTTLIEVTVPSTIRVEGRRNTGPTWFSCQFYVGNGRTSKLRYKKL